ncbi:MAG: hypothetical protein Q8M79_12435 [Dehalococcoidia bacterium]|nr:hypothetical protein [Dehalococcoidia bacterium]
MTREDQSIRLALSWEGAENLPILFADQFSVMFLREDQFVLTIGQVSPPVLTGTEQEVAAQASTIDSVSIRPLARLFLTRSTLDDLVDVLARNRERHDVTFGSEQQ